MSDLSLTREIYRLQLNQFREGGMSPAKTEVHEQILATFDRAHDVDEWKKIMEAEKLWDLAGKAVNADQHSVQARAFQESHFGEPLAEAYDAIATAIMNARTSDEDGTVHAAEEKAEALRTTLNRRYHTFHRALAMIGEYMVTSDFFTIRKKGILQRFTESIHELGGFETFAEMISEDRYAASVPYAPSKIETLIATGREMMRARIEEKDITPDERSWATSQKNRLMQSPAEVERIEEQCRQSTRYRLFAVDIPDDEPGSYDFELLWEHPAFTEKGGTE